MSTKAIREALEQANRWRATQDQSPLMDASRELDDIEEAAVFLRSLAPAEVVELFKANPSDPKLLDWLRGADLMHGIANDHMRRLRAEKRGKS